MKSKLTYSVFALLALMMSCGKGDNAGESAVFSSHETCAEEGDFDLHDIQDNGELIVLTLYGSSSYFEYRGENFGSQYLLADAYANSIGVGIRVDVCRSREEMLRKLLDGDGDVIAYGMSVGDEAEDDDSVAYCGAGQLTSFLDSLAVVRGEERPNKGERVAWAVRSTSTLLAESLDGWMKDNEKHFFDYATFRVRTSKGRRGRYYAPRRKVYAPILNLAKGQISVYDHLFKTYSARCRWDWRLLAAQAYQESGFDPNAVSWMGALGLMQLMPSTAHDVGVGENEVFNAESSVRGAVRLICQLEQHYSDVRDEDERINFVLAAYNAGAGHVDDARALCRKSGGNADVWQGGVATYVLRMSDAAYYNDEVVQHGYFRGSETYGYVNSIRERWRMYKSKIK
ncbi:MAG: transglycosylase SLT domain-containing protein [Bacteroidaceae bacterium]|nr:transglycosylase SLT domain-containing protein [Bacteroidaceae bacterium]